MDYEELYRQYQLLEKTLKEELKGLQKLQKAIGKEMEQGDNKKLAADIVTMKQTSGDVSRTLEQIHELTAGFDVDAYIASGSFARQLLDLCKENHVDVIGNFPAFEMFPYKVLVDTENQDVYLNRKKISCIRPASLVQTVQQEQAKLMKASFNATRFAGELADAYDLAVIKLKKPQDSDVYLQTLYKFLVPMSRFRRDYDQQNFAFDVARLYTTEPFALKDGRKMQFGPSRNNKKALRILDNDGREQYLATIRFYR